MIFLFHPDAENELNEAIDYYESCQNNLGLDFATEVYNTIQRILHYPDAWQTLDNNIKRCLTNRFPFGIIYYQRDDEIIILAVMHTRRKPNYWKNRV